jgi:hypothetical protein
MSVPDQTPATSASDRRTLGAAVAVGIWVLLGLMTPAPVGAATTPSVPANLAVPPGNVLFLVGHARGYQIYTCQAEGSGFAWVLQAPWAGLFDDAGKAVALHYGGPSWTAPDGSTVVAARVASAPAPSGNAIPWLLLRATSTSGRPGGSFSSVTYIQRINTTGGLAPVGGCDASTVGALVAVHYTADYYFYRAG